MSIRDGRLMRGLCLACGLTAAGSAVAADLPVPVGAVPALRTVPFRAEPAYRAGLAYPGFQARPYFAEASRFDIYGYPVVPAAPDPRFASTGCPVALQPIYDATGNFAGYSPLQACR